jgi:dienelactone hydrolase
MTRDTRLVVIPVVIFGGALAGFGCGGGGGDVDPDAGNGQPDGAPDDDGGTDTDPYDEWVHSFDYDDTAPLDLQVESTTVQEGMEVSDITYAGWAGAVPAYLVVPPGAGPFAAIVYLHWGGGDRGEFLDEAVDLAQQGAAGLLVDAPWNRPDDPGLPPDEAGIQIVVDLRRGLDLLASMSQVDPNRIAFVGHSFGASRGGVLAGVEKRFAAFVLATGYGRPSIYDGATAPGEFMDGIYYVGHAAPAPLFFQFALEDEYVTEEMALEYYDAASEPKSIAWYAAGHQLNAEALAARDAWLAGQLD